MIRTEITRMQHKRKTKWYPSDLMAGEWAVIGLPAVVRGFSARSPTNQPPPVHGSRP